MIKIRVLRSNEKVREGDFFNSRKVSDIYDSVLVLSWAWNKTVAALRKKHNDTNYTFLRYVFKKNKGKKTSNRKKRKGI
jgi:hypothetical protein